MLLDHTAHNNPEVNKWRQSILNPAIYTECSIKMPLISNRVGDHHHGIDEVKFPFYLRC